MSSDNIILVKYGEMFLKSAPVRRGQEKILKSNIKSGFKKAKITKTTIKRDRLRLVITVPKPKISKACDVLEKTFGISYFSVCESLDTSEVKKIQAFTKKMYAKWVPRGKTFAIRVKRSGSQKEKYTSMQLAKKIGDVVNRKVDLTNPDVDIFVEVKDNSSLFYTEKKRGPGGMPVGSSGIAVCLISGGIDSAVAAWLMMKRGCRLVMLYADNGSYNTKNSMSQKRVMSIIKILRPWSNGWKMPVYSFDNSKNFDRYMKKKLPSKFICLFCKRMMYQVANKLAEDVGAEAIITGETLGEVASQTLSNLKVLDDASNLPVFRPLIGNDKKDNIELAKNIGTFEKSIAIRNICKAVPDSPRTKGKISEIEEIESKLPMKKLVRDSAKSIKEIR